jgi:hypothetical protein
VFIVRVNIPTIVINKEITNIKHNNTLAQMSVLIFNVFGITPKEHNKPCIVVITNNTPTIM